MLRIRLDRRRGRRYRAAWRQTADRWTVELSHPVRLEAMSTPYPLHRTDANPGCPRHRHRRTAPVTGRRRWASQRQGEQTFSHLRAQRRNARPSCLVPPKVGGPFLAETFLPTPDHRLGLAGGLHDRCCVAPSGRQKDDLCPPYVLLRAITALSLLRSARLNWIFVRSCIPQTRTRECFRESPSESKCQIWTTSDSFSKSQLPHARRDCHRAREGNKISLSSVIGTGVSNRHATPACEFQKVSIRSRSFIVSWS